MRHWGSFFVAFACVVGHGAASLRAEVESPADKAAGEDASPKLQETTLAGGGLVLSLPAKWKARELRSRILEREYAVPAEEGDAADGRLTMMRSGGSVQQNVDRWIGQFTQPDGKPTRQRTDTEQKKVAGQDATIVSISGTFKERLGGGPFAPGKIVERPNYRMLGAILRTKDHGQYFFKLYGPEKTIAAAKESFLKMVQSVRPR